MIYGSSLIVKIALSFIRELSNIDLFYKNYIYLSFFLFK